LDSVGDIYHRVKEFKKELKMGSPLFFAKVDVQAAFDTIPQSAVLKLMTSLPRSPEYRLDKHVEIKVNVSARQADASSKTSRPMRNYITMAKPSSIHKSFDGGVASELAGSKKSTVFVETVRSSTRSSTEMMQLLREHVERNMVKIGKKFYRQKSGIPQGSVLSSLLCNYFYAGLESQHLDLLQEGKSLLLRLVDDFLLITTDREHAKSFLHVMHSGLPEYGVQVSKAKTLTNFEVTINGQRIARLAHSGLFPYCGTVINTKTLEIMKDCDRNAHATALSDSMTVEFSQNPGQAFHRKVLSKISCL
jgi:telomerase reverse transcriptase